MENYTEEDFFEDVRAEAKALRQNATPNEICRLDFSTLDPDKRTSCIYGQMTGVCTSNRASELIHKCCIRYFYTNMLDKENTFESIQHAANGRTIDGINSVEELQTIRGRGVVRYLSAIETYIMMPEAKNAELIAYLRSQTDTLEL